MVRWIQRLLFGVGFVILGYCGAYYVNTHLQQKYGNRELDRLLSNREVPGPKPAVRSIPEGELVGRVEIPKLHFSAVVFQGTDNNVLDRGVGHLDGSALPGQPGNVVLAAHRDTFFRSLRNIHTGDTVDVTTPDGARSYTVDSTTIVDPTQTSVMAPTPTPSLTLITCYPFYFVGHAPKRFIVRAHDTQYDVKNNKAAAQTQLVAANEKPEIKPEIITARLSDQDAENLTYVFNASE
ncbi:MAG TPA: class D sortase [Bryobacteraceae bacterium]|jgi:sortase A|nr:class D sortase [Bryobacteraceae bacterium]